MSTHKKIRPVAIPAEESSAKTSTHQPGSAKLAKDELAIKTSLKERARLMLEYPADQNIHDETDVLQLQSQASISNLYQSLNDQSIRTSQLCMDAELRAIAAIEERITAELRLIEADYSCIGMEVRARTAIAEKLKEAEGAVAAARARENAVMNEIDIINAGSGSSEKKLDQKPAQKRLNAELRVRKMQRIRMDAEQCAIQEIESLVAMEDVMAFDSSRQCLSEDAILQMALENGMLATQVNSHTAQGNAQAQKINAETEANRLQDNIRNSTWQNFFMESPTLH